MLIFLKSGMLKVYFQTYWRHRVSKGNRSPSFHVFFFFYKELKVQILNQKCMRKFVCIWQIRRHHTCLIKHKTQISEQSLHSFSLIFFFFLWKFKQGLYIHCLCYDDNFIVLWIQLNTIFDLRRNGTPLLWVVLSF